MLVADSEKQTVLTATGERFRKRTPISDYTRHGRGTQGMIGIQTSEAQRKLVGAGAGGRRGRDHAQSHRAACSYACASSRSARWAARLKACAS